VRDQDEAGVHPLQVVFQPVLRIQVQVIGRLVQKHQIRLPDQDLCQPYSHLPSGGELLHRSFVVLRRETQPFQDPLQLALLLVSTGVLKHGLQFAVLGHRLLVLRVIRGQGGNLVQQAFSFLHRLQPFGQGRDHLFPEQPSPVGEPALREVPDDEVSLSLHPAGRRK